MRVYEYLTIVHWRYDLSFKYSLKWMTKEENEQKKEKKQTHRKFSIRNISFKKGKVRFSLFSHEIEWLMEFKMQSNSLGIIFFMQDVK